MLDQGLIDEAGPRRGGGRAAHPGARRAGARRALPGGPLRRGGQAVHPRRPPLRRHRPGAPGPPLRRRHHHPHHHRPRAAGRRPRPSVAEVLPDAAADPEAAVVSIDPATGHVLAMVGGRDYFGAHPDGEVQPRHGPGPPHRLVVQAARAGRRAAERARRPRHDLRRPRRDGPHLRRPTARRGTSTTTARAAPACPSTCGRPPSAPTTPSTPSSSSRIGTDQAIDIAHAMGIDGDARPVPLGRARRQRRAAARDGLGLRHPRQPRGPRRPRHGHQRHPSRRHDPLRGRAPPAAGARPLRRRPGHRRPRSRRSSAAPAPRPSSTGPWPARPARPRRWRNAWFCGYVPQLATAVWVGFPGEEQFAMVPPRTPIRVTGGSYPARDLAALHGQGHRRAARRRVHRADAPAHHADAPTAAGRPDISRHSARPPRSRTCPGARSSKPWRRSTGGLHDPLRHRRHQPGAVADGPAPVARARHDARRQRHRHAGGEPPSRPRGPRRTAGAHHHGYPSVGSTCDHRGVVDDELNQPGTATDEPGDTPGGPWVEHGRQGAGRPARGQHRVLAGPPRLDRQSPTAPTRPTALDDTSFPTAAEPICAATVARHRGRWACPPRWRRPLERAEMVDEENALLRAMVVDLAAARPPHRRAGRLGRPMARRLAHPHRRSPGLGRRPPGGRRPRLHRDRPRRRADVERHRQLRRGQRHGQLRHRRRRVTCRRPASTSPSSSSAPATWPTSRPSGPRCSASARPTTTPCCAPTRSPTSPAPRSSSTRPPGGSSCSTTASSTDGSSPAATPTATATWPPSPSARPSEETALEGLEVLQPAVDIDVHEVAPPGDPVHRHLDLRFLVLAPAGAGAPPPPGNHECPVRSGWVDRHDGAGRTARPRRQPGAAGRATGRARPSISSGRPRRHVGVARHPPAPRVLAGRSRRPTRVERAGRRGGGVPSSTIVRPRSPATRSAPSKARSIPKAWQSLAGPLARSTCAPRPAGPPPSARRRRRARRRGAAPRCPRPRRRRRRWRTSACRR